MLAIAMQLIEIGTLCWLTQVKNTVWNTLHSVEIQYRESLPYNHNWEKLLLNSEVIKRGVVWPILQLFLPQLWSESPMATMFCCPYSWTKLLQIGNLDFWLSTTLEAHQLWSLLARSMKPIKAIVSSPRDQWTIDPVKSSMGFLKLSKASNHCQIFFWVP